MYLVFFTSCCWNIPYLFYVEWSQISRIVLIFFVSICNRNINFVFFSLSFQEQSTGLPDHDVGPPQPVPLIAILIVPVLTARYAPSSGNASRTQPSGHHHSGTKTGDQLPGKPQVRMPRHSTLSLCHPFCIFVCLCLSDCLSFSLSRSVSVLLTGQPCNCALLTNINQIQFGPLVVCPVIRCLSLMRF